MITTPYWIAGEATVSDRRFRVENPYDNSIVGIACCATDADVERAVAAAHTCRHEMAMLTAHARATALDHISQRLNERLPEMAELITSENGKPMKWARAEAFRTVSTFRWAAEEVRRWSGTVQRLDTEAGGIGRMALVRRVPRGPVLAITPFNFPLNLVAHKVAPALAAGSPVVVKPAPQSPLCALLLGEILAETELPAGACSVLPTSNKTAAVLVGDSRLPVISFTGSDSVGWGIRDAAPRKHVTLELGGNAAVVVCPDWQDLDTAADQIATFATYQAGQSCISVQRVFAHHDVYEALLGKVVNAVRSQGCGDPRDPDTTVGPMVDRIAAERVELWVDEAVSAGAQVLIGGDRHGATYAPTVLCGVPSDAKVVTEEVFGPILVVESVDSIDEALDRVNDSRYGLQVGVFTRDLPTAFRAAADLDVGGVIIGDVPSFRADQIPYGGVKQSGIGREGVLAAMNDFTEEKVTVLSGISV